MSMQTHNDTAVWTNKPTEKVRVYTFPNVTFDLLHRTLQSWQRPESMCISNCNCYTASVSPVCGSNGVTYLSACFAGCTKPVSEAVHTDWNKLYHDCQHFDVTSLFFVSEPDQLYVYIQHHWGRRGFTGEMSQSRLSGGLPHLPMCYLCVQHDRSHGPDTLCHHPYQASRPAALRRLPTRGSCWHLWLRERQKPWNQSHWSHPITHPIILSNRMNTVGYRTGMSRYIWISLYIGIVNDVYSRIKLLLLQLWAYLCPYCNRTVLLLKIN